jgi:hypothetical protein
MHSSKHDPTTLVIGLVSVHMRLQRKGVAKEFYEKVESFARELGYRYILGNVEGPQRTWLQNSRGRVTVEELTDEELRTIFGLEASRDDLSTNFMIQRL